MKAGLISFHNAYNYGAALQAYALQEYILLQGVDCEYIHYVNAQRKATYDMGAQFRQALQKKNAVRAAKVLVGTPFIRLRGLKFNAFYAKQLRRTKRMYTNADEAASLNDAYDRFIVGSDQVWNPDHNGGDTAFLLSFVRDSSKKISYSSSFGLDVIPEEFREDYIAALSDFAYLSTREQRGIELIRELTGRKAQLVLDPVFLLPKEKWNALRKDTKRAGDRPYVFFYTNSPSQVTDFLCTGYPMDGLDRHILSSHVKAKDFVNPHTKVKVSMSPENFLGEIANAALVVTASFHCLAFSIIYEKPFMVMLTGNYGRDERIINLLRMLGLEDRILTTASTAEQVAASIDYATVREKLKPLRDESENYLRSALFGKPYSYTDTAPAYEFFCEDERCTGCTACMAVCPHHAVSMVPDAEGFQRPIRDAALCIHCGKCHTVCQALKMPRGHQDAGQRFFAAKNQDDVRKKSSSGGVFTALSDYVLAEQGVIIGAAMTDEFRVKHTCAATVAERDALRGTCYVQSDLGHSYEQVRRFLQEGRTVLFVGTPCQVEGLRLFLGEKPERLILCDIVCHGAPSPMVFDAFIRFLSSRGKLTRFRFRDKALGWEGYTVSAVIDGKKKQNRLWLNSFNNLFSHNVINRPSCSSCRYTNYCRTGDITIGDFWGIQKTLPEFKDVLGVSLVIANTELGRSLLQQLKGLELREVRLADTKQNSLTKPAGPSSHRFQAFYVLRTMGYETVAKKYGEWNSLGYVKNILRKAHGHG